MLINARMEERAGIVRTPVGKLNAFYRGKKNRKRSSRGRNNLKLSMPTLAAALKLAGAVPARPGGQAPFPYPRSHFPASKLLAAPRSWPDLARTRMSNRLTVHCRRPWRDRASKRERERMPGSWIIVGLVTAMAAHGRNDRFRRYVYGWGCRNHA